MQNPVLTILYQMDPLNVSIGGIQTTIMNFIKYAPEDFKVKVIGITSRESCDIGKWETIQVSKKYIQFLPLFYVKDDNVRGIIPTTLRYSLALFRKSFNSEFLKSLNSGFLHFHRIEPSISALGWHGEKTLFIHADIQKQVNGSGKNNTILWRYFPSAYYALESLLLKQFSTILSCNSKSLIYLADSYPTDKNKFKLIRNTVDDEVFFPLSTQEKKNERHLLAQNLGLPDQTRFISFVGRLHPQKDPLLLIRSMALLDVPDIHLLIIGEGELKGNIQSEIESLDLESQVTLLGGMQTKDIAEYLKISELLVLTSVYEGLPMVVLEALACGIPIVTTNAGETPNLLSKETGVVTHDRTPKAVTSSLDLVLNNSQSYPDQSCVLASQPYLARKVITELYEEMRDQWQNKLRSSKDIYSTV